MADYIYLLQNRLSAAQQTALQTVRDVAKAHSLTVFLVGGAVRDLTSGSPVRDLDVVVQGNALKLKKDIELAGAVLAGEVASWQAFFAYFPGSVRVEIGSTLSVTYPKPGKPVAQPGTILDDLRRRDFTANAMALSLNEGSFGLLMDPMNGVADIENRQLRLVSNYGFIEDPARMIRAARFAARLGWTMDEKTQTRYETGKAEKYIAALSTAHRGYETEEIFHEEDPLRVLRKLEQEGWMKYLFPAMTATKANSTELDRLREVQTQLQVSGINPDPAAAHFPLLTAKLAANEVDELKKSFVRQGFVREIEGQEAEAKEFATQLAGKGAALPSQAWKLIHASKPEAVLSVAFSSKNSTVVAKLKSFYTEWPKARQKVPFVLMQEMRIVPDLGSFNEVVEKVFFELMDGNLTTPEEQKAFLEPFSPPAPPPPVRLARSRAGKKDSKASKGKKKVAAPLDENDEEDLDRDLDQDQDEDQDHEVAGDEGTEEEALPPDDENEDTTPVLMDEENEEFAAESEPFAEPKVSITPEPTSVATAEAVQVAPKRSKATRAKAAPPSDNEPTHSVEAASLAPAKVKIPAPAKKAASSVASAATIEMPAAPLAQVRSAKLAGKTAAAPAKKTGTEATPTKTAKGVEPPRVPAKTVNAKEAPATAKKASVGKARLAEKPSVTKVTAPLSKTMGKK